jgi:endonuclease/exonuclease/phosphatase family metal-dependent hydrolase
VTRLRAATALALAALILLPAVGTTHPGRSETRFSEPITVMTRNLFLGTNLSPVIDAAARTRAGGSWAALAQATYAARAQVDDTDFAARAGVIADEIAEHEPDLVGLQEVALWRSGPLEPDAVGVPNATQVDYDFAAMLLAALAVRGHLYTAAVTTSEVDLETPSRGPGGERPRDVRITLRDVILLRAGEHLTVLRKGSGHFRAQRTIAMPGPDPEFTRGYAWVDVRRGAQELRFVNTHLEVGDSRISHAQAQEIAAGPGTAALPVVVVCDCNSDPKRPLRSLPYRVLVGAGFVDQWRTLRGSPDGHTCCVPNTLRQGDAGGLDHRVDFIFTRSTRWVRAESGAVVGQPAAAQTRGAPPLRPSDHGGVVLRLRGVRR